MNRLFLKDLALNFMQEGRSLSNLIIALGLSMVAGLYTPLRSQNVVVIDSLSREPIHEVSVSGDGKILAPSNPYGII